MLFSSPGGVSGPDPLPFKSYNRPIRRQSLVTAVVFCVSGLCQRQVYWRGRGSRSPRCLGQARAHRRQYSRACRRQHFLAHASVKSIGVAAALFAADATAPTAAAGPPAASVKTEPDAAPADAPVPSTKSEARVKKENLDD